MGLVFGGGAVGMMGALANGAAEKSTDIVGVLPRFLFDREPPHPHAKDIRVVNSMHDRKLLMYDIADGFLFLPGGFGTLDEAFEILTWRQLGLHGKPMAFYAENDWHRHLKAHFSLLVDDGMVSKAHRAIFEFLGDESDLLRFIEQVRTSAKNGGPGTGRVFGVA